MARSLQRLQAKVKRSTHGSDNGSDIDGSSFTGNPFAGAHNLPPGIKALGLE